MRDSLRVICMGLLLFACPSARAKDVVIIADAQARAAIFVPPRVMDDPVKTPEEPASWRTFKPEAHRRRLRESVRDFADILQRITGAKVEVVKGKPGPGEKRVPILIGEYATEAFGKPAKSYPYRQGLRIVVNEKGVGLAGESDLATSYSLYTLLHQLGCRWYFPSPLGEVLPSTRTLSLREQDLSTGPYTIYRGIWYTDSDYARRNRMGGAELAAGHALEFTVPKELRKTNPEIRAIIGGKPHEHFVKWTHPLVARSIADALLANIKKDPDTPSFSLSPDDGMSWDESDDRKFDAGDFDPATQTVSKTDRLMVLANRVAERVTARHPNALFGILAYADYTRPPVKQKVHPNVIPEIAPITYSRAQPMNDDREPNNKALRNIVEGWAKVSPRTSYYFYGWFLAELSSPNPMIAKWSHDIPYIYQKGNCRFWQPETLTNFESSMHGLYLGLRLAWDPTEKPKEIVDELHQKLYGSAGRAMGDYWHFIDRVWVDTPEYAGCGFGHLRRWNRKNMTRARELMNKAVAAAKVPVEKQRVQMANDSLALFEDFMNLREDLAAGRFAGLDARTSKYIERLLKLGATYEKQYAFGHGLNWAKDCNVNNSYFHAFYRATYDDAARVARDFTVLTTPVLRSFRYAVDREKKGEASGWAGVKFDATAWKTTDVAVDTWSALGLHNYMGSLWYRTGVKLPAVPKGKKVFLWIGATDGRVKLFVNGKHIPYAGPKGEKADSFSGYSQPVSLDITAAVTAGENQLALFCTREFLNELGTGGLLSPVVIYREK
ncbi:MAG TPA: DUF4838 domain-containing protein [Gemmataceae bacterium]|nr:DUF4838 domain-containing protein [Gemmataceae bacterium]